MTSFPDHPMSRFVTGVKEKSRDSPQEYTKAPQALDSSSMMGMREGQIEVSLTPLSIVIPIEKLYACPEYGDL
jgi:hypothetical protein